ncbi:MAG: EamA family transporter, partial [Sphingobacterium sp.]
MKNKCNQPVVKQCYLILAYLAIYVVWGTTYLANQFTLQGFQAFQLSGFRFIAAGTILLLLSPIKQVGWPTVRAFKVYSISGILMLVGGSGLVVYAQEYISSGYAAVLVATEPLWFIILDKKNWRQYFSNFYVIIGILVGFAGIVLFIWHTPGNTTEVQGISINGTIIALLSSVLWVIGALYAKNNISPAKDTSFRTAIQLFAAGLFAFILA